MFWTAILGMVSCILMIPVLLKCPMKVSWCVVCVAYSLVLISGVAVYICGIVWRYGTAGKFASGDDATYDEIRTDELLQLKSGTFMNWFYIISVIMFCFSVVCACCICVV